MHRHTHTHTHTHTHAYTHTHTQTCRHTYPFTHRSYVAQRLTNELLLKDNFVDFQLPLYNYNVDSICKSTMDGNIEARSPLHHLHILIPTLYNDPRAGLNLGGAVSV